MNANVFKHGILKCTFTPVSEPSVNVAQNEMSQWYGTQHDPKGTACVAERDFQDLVVLKTPNKCKLVESTIC